MGYSNLEDLTALLPEATLIKLSNDQRQAEVVDLVNIDQAINQADREIDGFVGLVRTVPLNPVPQLIQTLSGQMAIFNLYRRRGQVPDMWQSQYSSAKRTLERIGQGSMSLGAEAGATAEPAERVLASSSPRIMGGSGGMLEKF